jgi:hypothetical protein
MFRSDVWAGQAERGGGLEWLDSKSTSDFQEGS